MNVATTLLISIPVFLLGYFVYGSFISRLIGIDPKRKTPAHEFRDNVDYVPTQKHILFGHQFASIAGAGPIIGPTIALMYGFLPVWLWIVLGGIFLGAVHDFTALFVSLRNRGKSIAHVAYGTLGKFGFILFISFTIIMIILVTSAFLNLSVKALTSVASAKTLGLSGTGKISIGGVVSTSVVLISLFAPLLGFLAYKKKTSPFALSALAISIASFSVWMGGIFPLIFPPLVWFIILSIYALVAAGIPVWMVLQPRDFINVHLLYVGIIAMILGLLSAGFKGLTIHIPVSNVAMASAHSGLGPIWPVLFVVVACGAISGFHALVSGGTVSKQVHDEGHLQMIGFGSMILESLLAVCVILVVAGGISFIKYISLVFPGAAGGSNPVLAFSLGLGNILNWGLGVPVVLGTIFGTLLIGGFVLTSLDTAVRLNRYLFEELWLVLIPHAKGILKSYWFNAGLSVVLMIFFAATNAYITIWPIFGTANQLLAALTLLAVSAWLISKGKGSWFTFLPAIFMLITTLASLIILLFTKYIPTGNIPLILATLLLLFLSIGVVVKAKDIFIS